MPMPPVINPYDPRKKPISGAPSQPQQGSISTHDKKPEQAASQAVQSNLPSMQQGQQQVAPAGQPQMQQAPAVAGQPAPQVAPPKPEQRRQNLPVTYQQQAGAVVDPRFTQALSQKYTAELQQKQQAFEQQQAEYQKQLQQAQSGIGATADVQNQLSIINNPTSTPEQIAAATAQYEKLMSAQAQQVEQSDAYRRAQAELAALTQLSGQGIAQKYGVGSGALTPDIGFSLASDGNLQQGISLAQKYAQQAGEQQKASQQQELLGQAKAEELKGLAKTGSAAAQSEFLQQLKQKGEAESKEKDKALDDLKNAIYLGKPITDDQIKNIKNKLGITDREISEMGRINISQIKGVSSVKDLKDLSEKVKELKESDKKLTPEQQNLISFYDSMEDTLKRSSDISGEYSSASKEELAKINALRKLTDGTELTEAQQKDIGKAYDPTKIASLGSALSAIGEGANQTSETKAAVEKIKGIDKFLQGGKEFTGLDKISKDLDELANEPVKGHIMTNNYQQKKAMDRESRAKEQNAFADYMHKIAATGPEGQKIMDRAYGIFNSQGRKDASGAIKKLIEELNKEKLQQRKIQDSSSTLITKGLSRSK